MKLKTNKTKVRPISLQVAPCSDNMRRWASVDLLFPTEPVRKLRSHSENFDRFSDTISVISVSSVQSDPGPDRRYRHKRKRWFGNKQTVVPTAQSMRRRANSLDYLPSPSDSPAAFPKDSQHSPVENKSSPFTRTASLSQRPFKKKIAFAEPETGLKDQRPRGLKKFKTNLDALFDSIERQDIEEVRRLLQQREMKINDLNSDNFTPLDVALMNTETEIAQLLLLHGAVENPEFLDPQARAQHLATLLEQADKRINDYTTAFVNNTSDTKENDKQLREWEWRLYMLRIMQNGFLSQDVPSELPVVSTFPLNDESIIVIVSASRHGNKEIVTKYKVEWSKNEDFSRIDGERLITDMRHLQHTISGLEKNQKWYVRVRAGNMKGFGAPAKPDPAYVVPSSWHECNNSEPKYRGCQEKLNNLLQQLIDYQRDTTDRNSNHKLAVPTAKAAPVSPKLGRKESVAKTFSKYTNLIFNSAPKLLKRLKSRGIYLAALLYNEEDDRVLVTMDENLPVVEVDDNYSKPFTQEFYWLAKISCGWEDIQQMIQDSSKTLPSQSILIRRKLLHAGHVLQNATGVQDLGYLHYKTFKDSHGSLLLLTINSVKKSITGSRSTTMKWIPISKLQKKTVGNDSFAPERLIPSLHDQVSYHKRSRTSLPRGLYLGYVKLRLQTTVDSLSIIVPETTPNVLPNVKVRDIPNVTREDWEWIQSLKSLEDRESKLSPAVSAFESKLKAAAKKLFSHLGIEDEYAKCHRIFNKEVIELNEDVLFILIFPPVEDVCTIPGQTDLFHSLSGYTSLPLQTFEMSNMNTYQPEIMKTYARLSSGIEMELFLSQQASREAFSELEAKSAKERQINVSEIQLGTDECWKNTRWVIETVQTAQDKHLNSGIPVGCLFDAEYDPQFICPSPGKNNKEIPRNKNGVFVKSSCILKVFGTEEVGLTDNNFAEILVNRETTTKDVIRLASRELLRLVQEVSEASSKLKEDQLSQLGLVVVAGSKERCLREDLKLLSLQNPWEKGQLFLRLKKEAKASKFSKSTPV